MLRHNNFLMHDRTNNFNNASLRLIQGLYAEANLNLKFPQNYAKEKF